MGSSPPSSGIYSPVKLTTKSELYASAPSYTYEQFDVLSKYIDYKLKEAAENISSGEIMPKPLDSSKSACEYCDYFEVCQFSGEHEKIESLENDEVYEIMNSILEGEGE